MKIAFWVSLLVAIASLGIWWAADSAAKSGQKTAAILASSRLAIAQTDAYLGKPVDREMLASTPGIDGALREAAEKVKASVSRQLRDPTDPIWGDIWTTDYVTICGTVNGRNAYGAYAGDEVFYAPDGTIAFLPGRPGYKSENLKTCFGSDRKVILAAATEAHR